MTSTIGNLTTTQPNDTVVSTYHSSLS